MHCVLRWCFRACDSCIETNLYAWSKSVAFAVSYYTVPYIMYMTRYWMRVAIESDKGMKVKVVKSAYLLRKRAAPPRPSKSRLCPAPQNLRNPQGAAGQNWLQIPLLLFITPTNDALNLKDEKVGKSFHFTLFTDCDYLIQRNTFKK